MKTWHVIVVHGHIPVRTVILEADTQTQAEEAAVLHVLMDEPDAIDVRVLRHLTVLTVTPDA